MTLTDDDSLRSARTPPAAKRSDGQPAGAEERRDGAPLGVSPSSRRAVLDRNPVVLSQAVRWTNRRRTRAAALLALLGGPAVVAAVVVKTSPGGSRQVQQATAKAWTATGALSESLRALERGDPLKALRPEARAARTAVQEAGKATKALDLGGAQASVQRRTVRALRADDAWIAAVSATLANRRSSRRDDLSRLGRTATERTAAIADDVPGARDTVGGTGKLLSASRRR